MGVIFAPGQTLGRGDLDIYISNAAGNPANAASISFALYYVSPVDSSEVLIGPETRSPVNPAVGEYYAAIMVPASATAGNYRIRWTFQELSSTPPQTVVQEFGIVVEGTNTGASSYTACQTELVRRLRVMLRDNCVGGEETVELDVDGERMIVRMDDLWEVIGD